MLSMCRLSHLMKLNLSTATKPRTTSQSIQAVDLTKDPTRMEILLKLWMMTRNK